MKMNLLKTVILILGFSLTPTMSFAAPLFSTTATGGYISDTIPVVGRVDSATQSWSGSLITNFDTSKTPVSSTKSSEMYFDNTTNTFSGFFVLTAACATPDCKKPTTNDWDESAFVTFNHGVSGFEAKFGAPTGDVYPMIGFAWSKSSGWIVFNAGSDPVKYNRTTGLFSGFAWSKNLGYISMNGLQMVTQVPRIVNNTQDVTVANHAASLGSNSGPVNGLDGYSLDINKWNDDNIDLLSNSDPKSSTDGSFAGVDVRLAKDYSYKITDPFGNYSSGTLKVVANIPSGTLESGNTISDGSSSFTAISGDIISSSSGDKKADGSDKHFMKINLHDKYGNEVKTVPGIKNVIATIKIDNTVSPNQTNFNHTEISTDKDDEVGRSIHLSSLTTNFDSIFLSKSNSLILSTYSHTFSGIENPNGQIDITSYMPTNNNLSYEIIYEVTPNNSDVGGTTNANNNARFTFTKVWDGTFQLINPSGGSFGINLPFQTSSSWSPSSVVSGESNAETYHLYTTQTGSGTSLHSLVTFTGANDPDISSHIWDDLDGFGWNYTSQGNSASFDLIPKMRGIFTGSVIDFQLNHQVVRKFTASGSSFAYKVGGATGTGVTQNRGVKILGSASSANGATIFALNDTDTYAKVGNFSKPQVRDMILQNVEALKRNKPSDVYIAPIGNYSYSTTNVTSSIRTLIVQGNLTLNDVIIGSATKPIAIIVIGGDIKIGPSVKNIYASIFTDHGLRSDGADSYEQLYIFGTLISGNTIGTSAQLVNNVCPDFKPGCNPTDKQMYDLNFLRKGGNNPIKSEYQDYPMVIEYNPKLTSDPPPGFKKIAR